MSREEMVLRNELRRESPTSVEIGRLTDAASRRLVARGIEPPEKEKVE